jgi:hypothetical protein
VAILFIYQRKQKEEEEEIEDYLMILFALNPNSPHLSALG